MSDNIVPPDPAPLPDVIIESPSIVVPKVIEVVIPPMVQLTSVESSYLAEVGHAEESLYIRFRNKVTGLAGQLFRFDGVSTEIHAELMRAESIGRHFLANIRGTHKGVLVVENAGSEPTSTEPPEPDLPAA